MNDSPTYWVWARFEQKQKWKAEGTYEENMRLLAHQGLRSDARIVPPPVPLNKR